MDATAIADDVERRLFAGGEWSSSNGGPTDEVVDPATEQSLGEVGVADHRNVDDAVAAAQLALADGEMPMPAERALMLHALADRIEANAEELAWIDVVDAGISITEMRRDVSSGLTQPPVGCDRGFFVARPCSPTSTTR